MMELFLPEQITLDGVSNALLGDVEETARRVNEYRPLPPEVTKRILDDLLGERVYSSNAIEGNTLDYRETVEVLKTGRLLESRKREAMEARNLGEAVTQVGELVKQGCAAHCAERLLEVHRTILKDVRDDCAGKFRTKRVMIEAAKFQPPDHGMVPSLVEWVMEQLFRESETAAVVLAAWAHWALARIHPFEDGNGRTARLWQDLVLFQGKLTCAIIRPEDRKKYLAALTAADEGRFDDLVQLVADRILTTFSHYLVRIREDEKTKEFVRELVGDVEDRTEERKLEYLRWSRKMERIRFEFESLAERINDASNSVKIQFSPNALVEQVHWEMILSGARGDVCYFDMCFGLNESHWRYRFFTSKRIDSADPNVRDESRVSLRLVAEISQIRGDQTVTKLIDSPISLREVFVEDNRYVVGRWNLNSQKMEYQRHADPMQIAQDFIREVFQYHLK